VEDPYNFCDFLWGDIFREFEDCAATGAERNLLTTLRVMALVMPHWALLPRGREGGRRFSTGHSGGGWREREPGLGKAGKATGFKKCFGDCLGVFFGEPVLEHELVCEVDVRRHATGLVLS
jgi:hypothetical protein